MTYIKKWEFKWVLIERYWPYKGKIQLDNWNQAIQLWNTIIIEYLDWWIRLNSWDWKTHTTKKEINKYLPTGYVTSIKGNWYYRKSDDTVEEFVDNKIYSI
jgi:hypothetical protein